MIRNRCIKRMRDHHIDTLLVTDEERRLRGIVGRKALFKSQPFTTAENMMYPVTYVAHIGDNIVDVLKTIEEADISNIPVLDQDEKLVGLLTNSNLVSTLSKQFLTEDNIAEEGAVQ